METLLGFDDEETLLAADDADYNNDDQQKQPSSYGYKLVPWINWEEWKWVKDSLFSDSPRLIASAINRISTWRSRGCLPVVIDVTASIIEIQQKDPFFTKDVPCDALHSEQMLAMLYCMAILRLVNCVVEKTRKSTQVSIAEAAGAIGIPRTLIDVRHEGSHRDLPALTLVRDSAVKAIHWLKSYYWERQIEQIPFQRDGTAKMRKEVKSNFQELASCLKVRKTQRSGASPNKRKYLKKQTVKIVKILVRLYSSFSSEVLSVLLEFLLQALDSSNLLEFPGQVGGEMHTLLDDWKLVIVKLSNKEPELLLMLLKAILNTIEAEEAMKYEIGTYFASTESRSKGDKIEQLSSLFAWLAGQLKLLKPFRCKGAKAKAVVSAAELNTLNPILMELLRKCLAVSSYGNKQLMDSTVHLAELMHNSPLMEKLAKLSLLSLSDSEVPEENNSLTNASNLLVEQDESIHEAARKLELVKGALDKHRNVKKTNGDLGSGGRWTLEKSWNPCPIGMLPRDLGSSGSLPVLDHMKLVNSSERTWQLRNYSGAEEPSTDAHSPNTGVKRGKREASYDTCLLDRSIVKKMRETVESYELGGEDVVLPTDIRGCLMINGVWKKIGEEELHAIISGVRILV